MSKDARAVALRITPRSILFFLYLVFLPSLLPYQGLQLLLVRITWIANPRRHPSGHQTLRLIKAGWMKWPITQIWLLEAKRNELCSLTYHFMCKFFQYERLPSTVRSDLRFTHAHDSIFPCLFTFPSRGKIKYLSYFLLWRENHLFHLDFGIDHIYWSFLSTVPSLGD